jgi:spermidine synthase/Tfp pilus assembly protein PilF
MGDIKSDSFLKSLKSLFIPCATVFISSFCIMVLELVAGRIIARFLGSSLYTWTSVIGVVLAGITIGNYTGGRLADLFRPIKTLSILFALCAIACLVTIVSNNLIGNFTWLWQFNWPTRILFHVTIVFLLPSALLGTISPVVAKMALEKGLPTGRTVGDIYAWGAAGSIIGTFAAGYYLIALMGTVSIIWAIAAVMIVMALLYGAAFWTVRAAAVIFLGAVFLGIGPWDWSKQAAASIGLKATTTEKILYENETNYCYIAVKSLSENPERRIFVQDSLVHSEILIGEPNKLQYTYEQIMAAITHRFAAGKNSPSFLILGGGGYALPRYLERFWPKGEVDVAEIDPGVTKAAFTAFELDPKTRINTIQLDARNYIDGLIEQQSRGQQIKQYDFIYEDALNDYSVPYQLTTREFNDNLYKLLTDDGIYTVELIDTFDTALFLGAMVNTLEQTFPFVTVVSETDITSYDRNTFVVVAAKHKLNLAGICKGFDVDRSVWYFNDSEMSQLRKKSNSLVLTDDYAPVDNLLAPVALRNTTLQSRKLAEQAENYAWKGNLQKALQKLDALARADPRVAVKAYGVISLILTDSHRTKEALTVYKTAVDRFTDTQHKDQMLLLRYKYMMLLKKDGKNEQAAEQSNIVEKTCRQRLDENPNALDSHVLLGNLLAEKGDFNEASVHFQKAVELQPDNSDNRENLIQTLEAAGKIDSAIQAARNAVDYFQTNNRTQDARLMLQYINQMQGQQQNQ